MLTLDIIRNNPDTVKEALRKRNLSQEELEVLDQIIATDDERKKIQSNLDLSLQEQKVFAKKIGKLYQQGDIEGAQGMKDKVALLKSQSRELEERQRINADKLESFLLTIPNVPHVSVPAGSTADDNEIVFTNNEHMPKLPHDAMAHWELAEKYNLLDFELGTKITGPGFPLYRGQGAKFQRALIAFFLDEATAHGYEEVIPPYLVNEDSARATGQLPDKEGQMYHMEKDDFYLIPTAEVPLTNMFRNVILDNDSLPVKITGYTPCFRREAGSYGADVKGLNRIHQFDKVELVQIGKPERSYDILDEMVEYVKTLLDKLELPYRILRLCGGDLGFTSALTYDFEVYSAGQKRWLEVSSVSNFETYQSNRLKLRYRDIDGNKFMAHTLNGSALALPRIVASLLENNQMPGAIKIPKVLHSYTNFELIKNK